jgi:photosystem II stability/assembly factor-like uncharacterized protein
MIRKAAGIVVAAGLLLGAAADDGPLWRPAGPFGGAIVIVQAASEPGRLYAGTIGGQGFDSGNGGDRWTPLPGITPLAGLSADLAIPLAVAPNDAETVYFRVRRGETESLLRSRDGGSHFVPIETGLDLTARFSYDLAIDPDDAGHLLLATSDGLFVSENGGDSWREAALAGSFVTSVSFDPRRPTNVAATVEASGPDAVWRSTDSGATWGRTASPPRWTSISRAVWSRSTEGTFFLAGNGRPFVSHDLGASFALLPLGRRNVRDLAELGDGTLLAATTSGIFRSGDGGLSWSPSGPEGGDPEGSREDVYRVEAAIGTIDGAYAAGSSGLFRSEDSGRTWSPASRGIRALSTVALVGGAAPYAVLYGAGIFRLTEAGWQSTGAGPVVRLGAGELAVGVVRLVAVDPADPENLLASLGDTLAGSRDGGKNWRILLPEPPPGSLNFNAYAAVFAPSDPRRVYVAGITSVGTGHGPEPALYRSSDRGATWTGANAFASLLALAVDPRDPDVLFAATETGFAESRNGGRHWRSTGAGLPGAFESIPMALRIDPANPDRLLLANDHQVWQSLDHGANFLPFGQSFAADTIERLELDASGDYLSVLYRGIFRYAPATGRFKPVGRRLPSRRFFGQFTLDPHHPGRLFAAVDAGGLLRLDLAP